MRGTRDVSGHASSGTGRSAGPFTAARVEQPVERTTELRKPFDRHRFHHTMNELIPSHGLVNRCFQ